MERFQAILTGIARLVLGLIPFIAIGALLLLALLSSAIPDVPTFALDGPSLLAPAIMTMVVAGLLWPLLLLGVNRLPMSRPLSDGLIGVVTGIVAAAILILPSSFAMDVGLMTKALIAVGTGLIAGAVGALYWWIAIDSKTLWMAVAKFAVFTVALFIYREIRTIGVDDAHEQQTAVNGTTSFGTSPSEVKEGSTLSTDTQSNEQKNLQDGITAGRRGDHATAVRLLKPIAESGNTDAQVELGMILAQKDYDPEPDYPAALKWMQRAYDQGRTDVESKIVSLKKLVDLDTQLTDTRRDIEKLDEFGTKLDRLETLMKENCGTRTCAIVDGKIVYKTQNGLYWHYRNGRILPREKWPSSEGSQ